MKIKGKGFILRTITMKDIQGCLECHQDKQSKKGFMSVPKNLTEAKKEIKKGMKDSIFLAIEVKGKFAGFVHLKLSKNSRYKHSAIIGYCVHKDFRGEGLATKATKLLTDYGFKKLKLVRISGWCRSFNKASAKVLENCGYELEGIMRKNKFKDGKYFDDMVWAKVK